MMKKMARVVEKPYPVLLCVIIVTAFMAYGITKLSMTTDFKEFLSQDFPSVRTTLELENKFGSVSAETILLKAGDVTSAEVIHSMLDLENTLQSDPRLENYIVMFSSYLDYAVQYIPGYQALPDAVLEASVKALMDNLSANPQTSDAIGRILTEKRGATVIYIYTNSQLTRSELLEKTAIMGELVDNFGTSHENLTLVVSGTYSSYNDINALMERDNRVLIPAAMVLVVAILFFTFRRFSDVLLCFAVIGLASVWAIGAMGHLGLKFTMIHVALVPLLLGMGVDYSVYMLTRYYEERGKGARAKNAIKISIGTIGGAILACVVTTMMGFGSFSISDMPPVRTMGVMAAFGIFFAFVLAVTLLPSVIVLRDGGKTGKVNAIVVKRRKRVDRALSMATLASERHRRVVVGLVIVVVAFCAISALGIGTTMSFETFIPSDVESLAGQKEMENLFGSRSFMFVLAKGDMLSPNVLSSMYEFENAVVSSENNQNRELVSGSLSLADLVLASAGGRELSALTEPEIAAIVDGLRATASTQTQISMLLTGDNEEAAIIFYTSATTDNDIEKTVTIIRSNAQAFTSGTFDLTTDGATAVGGQSVIIADILGGILTGMINTTVIALVLCFIVMVVIFRSPSIGVLAIIPVMLVVAWELGTLRLLGWSLDVLTMGISALVIGAGIDYSIQMVYRFREEKVRGRSPEEAMRSTVMNTGTALLAAMGTTTAVFIALMFSRMPVLSRFGGLTAVVVSFALIAALFVLPSFMMVYVHRKRSWRKKPVKK
jgi:hypothetical protein